VCHSHELGGGAYTTLPTKILFVLTFIIVMTIKYVQKFE